MESHANLPKTIFRSRIRENSRSLRFKSETSGEAHYETNRGYHQKMKIWSSLNLSALLVFCLPTFRLPCGK